VIDPSRPHLAAHPRGATVAAALRSQAATLLALADAIEAEPAHPATADDPWVDRRSSGLGRRFLSLCASGVIASGRNGRRVVARRSAVDAWIEAQHRTPQRGDVPTDRLAAWMKANGVGPARRRGAGAGTP
jgi:hypothetical protein